MSDTDSSLKTLERAFRILEFVRENEPVTLTQISDTLPVSKSTVHRYLSTLVSIGYLVKQDNSYRLSFEFLSYANQIQLREPSYPIVKRKVRELADKSGELVQFTTDENDRLVYLFKDTGQNGLLSRSNSRTFRPLHSTAGGKAILSTWPLSRVETYLERSGLEQTTDQTITEPDVLIDELTTVRERGYAINKEETVKGLGAVSVPIQHPEESVIGALGISGPISRVGTGGGERDYPQLLLNAKKEIELNIRLS